MGSLGTLPDPLDINDRTDTTITAADEIVYADATDSAAIKKDTVQGILDLVPAVANNAITLAKMASGTDGNIISYDASGDPVAIATGSDGQVLTSTGAGSPPAFEALPTTGTTAGSVTATTSGTSVTFDSIPTGTKRIDLILSGVSDDGTAEFKVQIGDAGGFETSGYVGSSARLEAGSQGVSTATDSYIIQMSQSGSLLHGVMSLFLVDATNHDWVNSHSFAKSGTATGIHGGGTKSLSAELTQVKLLIASGAFDAGEVNIHYWQ